MNGWRNWKLYTNLAYPCAAIPLWGDWLAFGVMLVAGIGLAYTSTWFHATNRRIAQRADVTFVMTYLAAGAAVYAAPWSPLVYVFLPFIPWFYWVHTWDINSQRHAPAWMLFSLTILTIQTGVWAIGTWVLVLLAGGAKYISSDEDSSWHAMWHVFGGSAQTYSTWII